MKKQGFPKNFYFSLVIGKIAYIFKITTRSIYITRVRHVASHNWFIIHQGNGSRGNEMRSRLRRRGVRGSPRVN